MSAKQTLPWDRVGKILEEKRSFLLTTHVNPEGDAIGSEVALARFLRSRSRHVRIVNPSPTPEQCRFLDPEGEIILFETGRAERVFADVDCVLIVDLSSWSQLGSFADPLRESGIPRVCIDHHTDPDPDIADLLLIDDSASAAGLLVFEMVKALGEPIPPVVAEPLYAAIITDTGCFRFSNTDARTFLAAAELIECGVRPDLAYRDAFENRRWASAKLLPPIFSTLDKTSDGKIAWVQVTKKMLAQAGGRFEDAEGVIEILRGIRGVEVCVVFKEQGEKKIRASLRSTGRVDLHRFAQSHGGGGHSKAAGLTYDGSLEEAISAVITGLEELARR
jgi:phosphoesterase RecJ-like protein